eukprot:TRINITY_DN59074_c0_g1_i1.p2 TRINITY_DN59074_c0_g1~~TRINITY_DN59074_c0_g1_i1.p2  ORF type:complete len:262 (-),score=54.31 TRINITY_DN59074_c0_g1_i1:123-842(-)
MEYFGLCRFPRVKMHTDHSMTLIMALAEYFGKFGEELDMRSCFSDEEVVVYGKDGALSLTFCVSWRQKSNYRSKAPRITNTALIRWQPSASGSDIDMLLELLDFVVQHPFMYTYGGYWTTINFMVFRKYPYRTSEDDAESFAELVDEPSRFQLVDEPTGASSSDAASSLLVDVNMEEVKIIVEHALDEVLGTEDERRAFLKFCREYHPDIKARNNAGDYEIAFSTKVFQSFMYEYEKKQ